MTNPPRMARLHVADVAERLGVTLTDMALATRLSRPQVYAAVTKNLWPRRGDQRATQALLIDLLRAHGASEVDLAALFYLSNKPANRGRPKTSATQQATAEKEAKAMLLTKQTLTAHAARHFKLFRNPFDATVDTKDQLFVSDAVRDVRDALWQCARQASFLALVAESGAGKTTILEDLEDRLAAEAPDVVLIRPSVLGMERTDSKGKMLKSADILQAICGRLAPNHPPATGMQTMTVQAQRLLLASTSAGNVHLLVIEEAHGLPDTTLKHLKRMHELRHGRRGLLGILLVAQPELRDRLADGLRTGTLREVAQRCDVIELPPLGPALGAYLTFRAAACGRELASLIDADAIEPLRQRLTRQASKGTVDMTYPLAVGNLCTRALNLAAEILLPTVTAEVVQAI